MAKSKVNIVSAFTWLSNCLDTQTLSASEQLVLLHLVKYLNRNFWKATSLSNHMLAKAIGKDDRTVKTALNKLIDKKLVVKKGGELYIGIEGANKFFSQSDVAESRNSNEESKDNSDESDSKVRTLADYL